MRGLWPLRVELRRCMAWYGPAEGRICRGLIWPWQDVVDTTSPEYETLVHHECHHRQTRALFEPSCGDDWTSLLECEHRTAPAARGPGVDVLDLIAPERQRDG